MKNPLDDPSIRKALEDVERIRRNPDYQARERQEEMLRRNPAARAALDELERRDRDPQYRALVDSIEREQHDPARRAALDEIERRNRDPQYRALFDWIQRETRDPIRRAAIEEVIRRVQNPNYAAIRDYISEFNRQADERPPSPAEVIDLVATVKELTPELIDHLKSSADDLVKLDDKVAEHLVGELLRANGFHDVRLVGQNSKTSADVFAVTRLDSVGMEVRIFVEVKRWKKRVGIEVVQQVLGAMVGEQPDYGWHAAMIVSVVGFKKFRKWTPEEIQLKGIELRGRDDLVKWLGNYEQSPSGLWLPKPNHEKPIDERY